MEFLPITRREMLDRGWDACDFVYIIGDAYVDHPSFGHAVFRKRAVCNSGRLPRIRFFPGRFFHFPFSQKSAIL